MDEWWHNMPLQALSAAQWEALCDGCAKCCLHKIEDEDSGEVLYTRIRCRYLNEQTCTCSRYENRSALVPDCIDLRLADSEQFKWLPSTCAYRLRANGERLPDWHPLVSSDCQLVHREGISILGRSISEEYVHPDGFDEHIVQWVE
jgi:uncharacterized cysteine cluster protein YcgN (CxxCxxCC family)